MICAQHVSQRFGSTLAVDDVSFTIGPGEIVGLVGAPGSGKSTLLRMLAACLPADSGRMLVCGHDVAREPLWVKRKIGYLAQHDALFEDMHVQGFLAFVAEVRGLEGPRGAERHAFVVERCGLGAFALEPLRECGESVRRRVGLAAALLHDPSVLLLDEPTKSLGSAEVEAMGDFMRELRPGHAILLSSSDPAAISPVANRLLRLHGGRIAASSAEALPA